MSRACGPSEAIGSRASKSTFMPRSRSSKLDVGQLHRLEVEGATVIGADVAVVFVAADAFNDAVHGISLRVWCLQR